LNPGSLPPAPLYGNMTIFHSVLDLLSLDTSPIQVIFRFVYLILVVCFYSEGRVLRGCGYAYGV
jgi:hypothetical protein